MAIVLAGCVFSQQSAQASGASTPLPAGGTYVAGAGSINSSGNAVTINQSTLRGVIDWSTFSLGLGNSITFKNGSGATLNRVTGSEMSSILGSIFSTGSVYLINPEGILIGRGAHINTGGDFAGSTLNLSNLLFMSGSGLDFKGTSKNLVMNLGNIFSRNGSVFLIGHDVTNSGTISAPKGTVGLAAGSDVLLKDSTGDQRVFVQASGGNVSNSGSISAAQAELKAKGGNVYALAGNNGGRITATGTAHINGEVWLISDGGTTQVTGSILSQNQNGLGGNVETSGHNLDISHASIATGQGGNWLLDPVDVLIDASAAGTIQSSLATTNVTVQTTATTASGPGTQTAGNGDITVASNIAWSSNNSLTLSAYRNIGVNTGVTISNSGAGNLTLRADNSANGTGSVALQAGSSLNFSQSTGLISILYDPVGDPKYSSPVNYASEVSSNSSWTAPASGAVSSQFTAYMLVNNVIDLANLSQNRAGVYALGTNIDASSNPNFSPLWIDPTGFQGILDGMGQTISNLTINSAQSVVGLFGNLAASGIVRNLNLTNVNMTATYTSGPGAILGAVTADNYGLIANVAATGTLHTGTYAWETGGLVGYQTGTTKNSTANVVIDGSLNTKSNLSAAGGLVGVNNPSGVISNSSATGMVNGGAAGNVGGLVGANGGSLTSCSASGAVVTTGSYSVVGGLAGINDGTILNSSATGSVTDLSMGPAVGGLVGYSDGPISGSNASGNVTATGNYCFVGGLVGYNDSGSTITNSFAQGSVMAGTFATAGGLAGLNNEVISGSYATGAIQVGGYSQAGGLIGNNTVALSSLHATGNVTATGNYSDVGGLIADNSAAISGSYATGTVVGAGSAHAGGLLGFSTGATTNSYATGAVSAGNGDGGDSPSYLGGLIGITETGGTVSNSYATGLVTGAVQNLAGGLIGASHAAVTQSNSSSTVSITINGSAGGLIGQNFSSISNAFATGNVSGQTNTLIGGLVGRDFTSAPISNSYATGSATAGSGSAVGGLTAWNASPITGSYATGAVSLGAGGNAGGLSGNSFNNGTIANSYATGAVVGGNGTEVGGLTGENDNSITLSYATGSVTGGIGSYAGGLTGRSRAPISLAYATGSVTGGGQGSFTGGLAGWDSATIANAYATGAVNGGDSVSAAGGLVGYLDTSGSISTSYSTGAVGLSGSYIGGLIGQNAGSSNVTSSYWDSTTSGQTLSAGGTGLTTVQWLTQGPAAAADPNWDFTNNWVAGYPYPVLKVFPYVLATLSTAGTRTYGGSDPAFSVTSAVDQNAQNALGLINGSLVPVTVASSTGIGTYNAGGTGQTTVNHQLTYIGSLTIDPATLILTGVTAIDKTYDGTTTAALSLGNVGVSGLVGEDTVTIIDGDATASFATKDAATNKPVTTSGFSISGPDAANYTLSIPQLTATISPAQLSVSYNAANKVYDGTTAATATLGTLSGILGEDAVSLNSGAFNFVDKNAGTGKSVTATGFGLSGAQAADYTVTLVQNGTASITPAPLTVTYTAANKVYDGTTSATAAVGAFGGLIGGDSVSLSGGAYNFADQNAGTGKTVSASGFNLTGAQAGDYTLTLVQNGTATITPAQLVYVAQPTNPRPFGTANPPLSGTVTGFVSGDTLAAITTGTAVFSTPATVPSPAGLYPVLGSGLTLTTNNYTLAQAPGNATALTINPITITIGSVSRSPGTPNPTFTFSYSGPSSDYLQSVLSNIVLVTNAPASDTPGIYQITALIPSGLASTIYVQPGTLTINSALNNSLAPQAPESLATIPAALETSKPTLATVLPPISGGSSSGNELMPTNAIGQFQVVIMPSTGLPGSGFQSQNSGDSLSHASFTEKSPDGRSKDNKSTYAAGAH